MNIFILDNDIKKSAEYHCDQHVNKMILEATQMICTVQHIYGNTNTPYKPTHPKHPCTLWAAKTIGNYIYLLDYAHYLNEEAKRRYKRAANHKSYDVLMDMSFPSNIPDGGITPFARAMPEQFKSLPDTVQAYREYYKTKTFATWKSGKPEWI